MASWGACLWVAAPHIWLGLHGWGKGVVFVGTHAPLGAAKCSSSRARARTSRSGETPLGSAVASGCPAPLKLSP